MKPTRTRIFVVDDHAVVRLGLKELIDQESDMVVCGEAGSAEEALEAIRTSSPDLAIVDLSLKGTGGLELCKNLRIRHPELPVLVVSMHDELLYAERALRAGARGYIMKDRATTDVQAAIRVVLSGKTYVSQQMSQRIIESVGKRDGAPTGASIDRLTDRELEVFELIGQGHGTREIARRLHLSIKTIETHRAHIKEKLDLKDAAQLAQHAAHWLATRPLDRGFFGTDGGARSD